MKPSDCHRNSYIKEYELIKGLKRGDYNAFDKLYDLYADSLYGFILKMTKSHSESEDILQETFLRVWYMREKISLDKSFKSFLFTISHNLIIDAFRARINNVDFELFLRNDIEHPLENSAEENADDFEELLSLAKRKITDKQRIIFELKYERGFSNKEIAETLGLSEKTIRNQLSAIAHIIRHTLFLILLFISGWIMISY